MKNNQPGTILEIKDLDINLGGKEIIKNVSLDIEENEIVGIVGVSGAGKTSLLNAIIGYYPASKGKVNFRGGPGQDRVRITDNPNMFKMIFGFSAQEPSFYPELTIKENLGYFASLYNMPADLKKKSIEKALNLVELQSHSNIEAMHLSGGMKKRLDIACALVHNPRILILDEPTSDMDPILRIQIWELLENINRQGTTIIIASHFLSELEHFCDRMAFLHEGKLKFYGKTSVFKKKYSSTKEVQLTAAEGKHAIVLKK